MKPRILLAALVLAVVPLMALSQAFTPRRPFIPAVVSSGITPPDSASIFSWWVANDLPRSVNVNAWTDRIAGIVLTQATASARPFMTASNHVDFTGVFASGQTMSNVITWSGSVLNWTVAWMIMHTNYGHSAGDWVLGTDKTPAQFSLQQNGGFPVVLGQAPGIIVQTWVDITNGLISDLMIAYDDSGQNYNCYTNGILNKVTHLGSHGNNLGGGIVIGQIWNPGFNYLSGAVYEVAIWTNLLDANSATNWHYLRTNKYGLTNNP